MSHFENDNLNEFDVNSPLIDINEGEIPKWNGLSNEDFPLPIQLESYIRFKKMSHEEKLKEGYKSLSNSKIRIVYWKYYFGLIISPEKQKQHYEILRKQYDQLLETHIEALNRKISDNDLDPLISNPLSTNDMVSCLKFNLIFKILT